MKKIAVIGSLNVDYVAYVRRQPRMGETTLASHLEIVPGGKGANQAFVLGRMGAEVAMFGAVGDDANGALELQSLASTGVDVSHVRRLADPTGMALVTVDAQGDNCIVVAPGANGQVTTGYIDDMMEILSTFDIIVLQLEIPLDTVSYAARVLSAQGKTVILDPAPAPGVLPDELIGNVDIITPNRSELALLTATDAVETDLEAALGTLTAQGARCVVASVGESGVVVAEPGGERTHYGAERVPVVDTTGAGDSLTAALAFGLATGLDVGRSVRFGNRVAASVVQQRGAQKAIPSAAELYEIWADCAERSRDETESDKETTRQ
ncbi:PfkB family carbohydrate kinase [Arthrobacter sp.]|uniref:ribokinase n=1 Tax=Arthrobacter sp. TaxID=1667 RepID=UPI003393A617